MKRIFCNYFTNLFTTTNPSQTQMEEVLEKIPRKITTEMNEELDKPFNAKEIITTLSQMCLTVVPRPYGFPAAFFQKYFKSVSK